MPKTDERRIVVVTGARQTGKTTLARLVYSDVRYLNLDDMEVRDQLRNARAAAWARVVGDAVLDEAQKEPSVFEKVKCAFDEKSVSFTSLLGSSRILLLRKVQEALAGRAFVYDLWPLMLSELLAENGGLPPRPLLDALLRDRASVAGILSDQPDLDISYQVLLLRPYARNLTSRVVKSTKLYWLDLGLLRQGTAQWGPLNGGQFETLVVGECHKWISTSACDARMFFYRTRSGMEVDMLLETPLGILGIEVKNRNEVHPSDARPMINLAQSVGSQWRGGLVVCRGRRLYPMVGEYSIWAVPAHQLF